MRNLLKRMLQKHKSSSLEPSCQDLNRWMPSNYKNKEKGNCKAKGACRYKHEANLAAGLDVAMRVGDAEPAR